MRLFCFTILLSLAFGSTMAQDDDKYYVTRLKSPIEFDGMPDEAAWQDIPELEDRVFQPVFDGEHRESTEMFITYDDKYVYVAGRMYYKDPGNLSNVGRKRDEFLPNNDNFGILLDTFNDNLNMWGFFTAPSGMRLDFTVFNDAQGDFPVSSTWNTFWDAKTVINDEGWFSEIRIPFSSLRFQDDNGSVEMGMIVWRWMAYNGETHMYPLTPNSNGPFSNLKPSEAKKVVFEGVYSQKPVYLAPYVLGAVEQIKDLSDDGTAYVGDPEPKFAAGFDLKYGITNNLTMDLTVNPDFAQVEVDDQQVNLTRFSLFFPEKRLFFQERASLFDFNMGGPNTLFYSRRIGLDEGEIIPIYGGVRLNGRWGPWDMGFLDMQTAAFDSIASTNYGVFRLRKQVITPSTFVGGILVNKIDVNGRFNTNIGLDGIFQLYKDHFFTINYAQTYETNGITTPFTGDHAKLYAKLERRSNKGPGYDFSLSRVGEYYDPEVGFELRENYTRFGNRVWWGWFEGEDSPLINHRLYVRGSLWKKNPSWVTESSDIGVGWDFTLKNQAAGDLVYQYFEENVADSFSIGQAEIPPGYYYFHGFTGLYQSPPRELNFSGTTYLGTFFDGTRFTLGLNPTWTPSSVFNVGVRYEYNKGSFKERAQEFDIHLVGLKTTLMFSTKLSATLYVQYNTDVEEASTNLRIRYNPAEGNDLFVVYNDIMNTNRYLHSPELPFSSQRSFTVKYTYTFNWGR